MDVFKNIFNNPLREKYKNTFEEDEFLGDYAVNFRSIPKQDKLEIIGDEIIDKCSIDCKKMFNFKETNRMILKSDGFLKKSRLFIFTKKVPMQITFVDVQEKGFIVEDFCIKVSLGYSMLTGGFKYNSYITNKKQLAEFISSKIDE